MKKLSKIKLQNTIVLKEQQMKAIYGGSGGDEVCAYSTSYTGSAVCLRYGGSAGAEFMAGPNGWWCCNCQAAYYACNY